MSSCTRLSFLLCIAISAGCSGRGTSAPAAAALIEPGGGTFAVTNGPLAGVKVEVPANASARPVRITADTAFAIAMPGFKVAGPTIALGPAMPFRAPVRVTIPFRTAGQASNENVILQRNADGQVFEVTPAAVDQATGLAEFDTLMLGTCWLAERLFLGVATEEFLPLEDGNQWVFENDLRLTMTMESSEPNLQGPVIKLRLDTPDDDLSFYLDRHWDGTTRLLGTSSSTGNGWQHLHEPRRWLPSRVTLGRTVSDAFVVPVHEPFGAATATRRNTENLQVTTSLPPRLVTSVGSYEDLLEVRYRTSELDATGTLTASREYAITLARYRGPVAIEAFGRGGRLLGGVVSGLPIGE